MVLPWALVVTECYLHVVIKILPLYTLPITSQTAVIICYDRPAGEKPTFLLLGLIKI